MACAPSATAFNPEPHTLLTVIALTSGGRPPKIAAWRAGFCPKPAETTLPMMHSSTCAGSTWARFTASRTTIAPWWHTAVLVIMLLAVSMGQAHALGRVIERHSRISLYVSTMAFEWVMVAFIWMGVRRRGIRLRELVGGKWKAPEDALLDVAIAF